MASKNKTVLALKEQNEKLKAQFTSLLDGYAKLELTDLKINQQNENQKRLIDFIQRLARRLDDDDLMDVLVEEFLVELGADRVSYILPGSGPQRRLAVSNEAVDKNIKRLAIPYFISPDSDPAFIDLIYKCIEDSSVETMKWKEAALIISDSDFSLPMEQQFRGAMEEEFNVVSEVECHAAMACSIRTSLGESAICLQRTHSPHAWSELQRDLLRDMCRYAGLLLEQMQMTQQIRDLKDQLTSLIESMPSAIIGMDLLGTITMWGGRAESLFDLSEDEALGRVLWELVPEYEFISSALMDVLRIEDQKSLEFEKVPYRGPDGKIVYHHASLFTMFGSNRGEIALRIDDVTKQVELIQQLLHAQRMETVGTLAGGLAHDFNNVLGGLVGTLSLLKARVLEDLDKSPHNPRLISDREDIEIMEACTARATDMVKRLLSLSRKSVVDRESLNFNSLVQNVYALCNASFESRIHILCKLPTEKLWINGNKTQLEQVILNLCVNARDAMPKGGSLTLELVSYRVSESFKLRHPNCLEENLARLKISDTGEGISQAELEKIFDPFYTTKSQEQGTGLGLSIVEKIVEEHRGFLDVQSTEGLGTSFSLYFYLTTEGSQQEKRATKKVERGYGHVLIVDDDEIMRKTISRILLSMGYSVSTASTGAEALNSIENGTKYDLVVLDVDMPGLNGLDVAQMLRKHLIRVPVLFCTGRQNQYHMHEALLEPNTFIIAKPFGLEALSQVVKDCFRKSSGLGT